MVSSVPHPPLAFLLLFLLSITQYPPNQLLLQLPLLHTHPCASGPRPRVGDSIGSWPSELVIWRQYTWYSGILSSSFSLRYPGIIRLHDVPVPAYSWLAPDTPAILHPALVPLLYLVISPQRPIHGSHPCCLSLSQLSASGLAPGSFH